MEKIAIEQSVSPPPRVDFSNMNSLIYHEQAHQIINLKPGDKNLELNFNVFGESNQFVI
jgi:predicted aminopeptidase